MNFKFRRNWERHSDGQNDATSIDGAIWRRRIGESRTFGAFRKSLLLPSNPKSQERKMYWNISNGEKCNRRHWFTTSDWWMRSDKNRRWQMEFRFNEWMAKSRNSCSHFAHIFACSRKGIGCIRACSPHGYGEYHRIDPLKQIII